jgi:hypothetical protein
LVLVCLALTLWLAPGVASPTAAESHLKLCVDSSAVTVRDGQKPLAEYRYEPSPYKPYLRRWSTPKGINVLRDAPHDHLHHHALMFAVGVDGVDYWAEVKGAGRQVHRALDGVGVAGGELSSVTFTQRIDWMAPAGSKATLSEERTLTFHREKGLEASLLTWKTRLRPGPGLSSVQLGGSHYFGLGMRFVTSMDEGGRFLNPTGKPGEVVRGTERIVRAPWCAYIAKVDGQPVTVAMFDAPENARHPAYWFTMTAPFAYLSATLNLYREALTLKADDPLKLLYGVALWDGAAGEEEIQGAYKRWLKLQE